MNKSLAEKEVGLVFKEARATWGLAFKKQVKLIEGRKVRVDFYLEGYGVAVDVKGQWYNPNATIQAWYLERRKALESVCALCVKLVPVKKKRRNVRRDALWQAVPRAQNVRHYNHQPVKLVMIEALDPPARSGALARVFLEDLKRGEPLFRYNAKHLNPTPNPPILA